jgi:hypothetical protein
MKKKLRLSVFFGFFLGWNVFLCPFFSLAATDLTGIQSEGVESAVLSEERAGERFQFTNPFTGFSEWFDGFNLGHLELGTRSTYFKIIDYNDSFVGSVDSLDSVQNYDPTRVFLDWVFWNGEKISLGTEITWDRVAARTITSSTGRTDGTLFASGPIWTLFARYKNESRFTPYAGLGAAFYNRTRVSKGSWHYGFSGDDVQGYLAWRQAGSPSWPNDGYNRTFNLDDAAGFVATFGCAIKIGGHWEADLYGRYTNVVLDNEYTLSYYGDVFRSESYEFDISNMAYGVGIKYVFGGQS